MKTVFHMDQKKVDGECKVKYFFGIVDADNFVTTLSYKQFLSSDEPYSEPSAYAQKEVTKALCCQLRCFNDKISFNMWSKENSPTFLQKVEKLLSMGAKWPKSGLLSI